MKVIFLILFDKLKIAFGQTVLFLKHLFVCDFSCSGGATESYNHKKKESQWDRYEKPQCKNNEKFQFWRQSKQRQHWEDPRLAKLRPQTNQLSEYVCNANKAWGKGTNPESNSTEEINHTLTLIHVSRKKQFETILASVQWKQVWKLQV